MRGVAWNGLDPAAQQGVYAGLHDYFESLPKIDDWQQVESLEDLTPAIELYNTLIGLGRYDDACDLFYERLERRHALPPERQPPAWRAAGGALPRRAGAVAAAEQAGRSSLHAQRAGAGV